MTIPNHPCPKQLAPNRANAGQFPKTFPGPSSVTSLRDASRYLYLCPWPLAAGCLTCDRLSIGQASGGVYVGGMHGGCKPTGEGDTVVDSPKVEEKDAWLVVEGVVVDFDYLYTRGSQGGDDVLYFSGDHGDIAVDSRPATANGLEV